MAEISEWMPKQQQQLERQQQPEASTSRPVTLVPPLFTAPPQKTNGIHYSSLGSTDASSDCTALSALRQGGSCKILLISDCKGHWSVIDELADQVGADIVVHTGDFGFFGNFLFWPTDQGSLYLAADHDSIGKISEKSLKYLIKNNPRLDEADKNDLLAMPEAAVRHHIFRTSPFLLSQLPEYLAGERQFRHLVFTIYGALEDIAVVEKFRSSAYSVKNLLIIDEAYSPVLPLGNIKLRLFGLGGSVIRHKLFDVGDGKITIAGSSGLMWTTLLQVGELVSLAKREFDPAEVRLLVTHTGAGREGLIAQLALALNADYAIASGSSNGSIAAWNPQAIHATHDLWQDRLMQSRETLMRLWRSIQEIVEMRIG